MWNHFPSRGSGRLGRAPLRITYLALLVSPSVPLSHPDFFMARHNLRSSAPFAAPSCRSKTFAGAWLPRRCHVAPSLDESPPKILYPIHRGKTFAIPENCSRATGCTLRLPPHPRLHPDQRPRAPSGFSIRAVKPTAHFRQVQPRPSTRSSPPVRDSAQLRYTHPPLIVQNKAAVPTNIPSRSTNSRNLIFFLICHLLGPHLRCFRVRVFLHSTPFCSLGGRGFRFP